MKFELCKLMGAALFLLFEGDNALVWTGGALAGRLAKGGPVLGPPFLLRSKSARGAGGETGAAGGAGEMIFWVGQNGLRTAGWVQSSEIGRPVGATAHLRLVVTCPRRCPAPAGAAAWPVPAGAAA